MQLFVIIKNKATGAVSQVPAKLWRTKEQQWKGVFEVVNTISEPPEVAAMKAKAKRKSII